jgi:2-dehydro-3-deoxyphosphogluconate aldolase/(4S)-4-hydroxy-2-oxoglutarate aldolase
LADKLRLVSVVPVVTLPDPSAAVRLADVLSEEGLPCLEVAFRAPGAADAIRAVREERPDILVGAGTVLTIDQASAALAAGAQFVAAPGTNARVIEHVIERGGRMVPGVGTASEIEANLERGLLLLKFFPAEALGGTRFLSSVHGAFPDVEFFPTGGITAQNLGPYLSLPFVVAVGGTAITPRRVLEAGDFDAVRHAAREVVAAARQIRPMRSRQ